VPLNDSIRQAATVHRAHHPPTLPSMVSWLLPLRTAPRPFSSNSPSRVDDAACDRAVSSDAHGASCSDQGVLSTLKVSVSEREEMPNFSDGRREKMHLDGMPSVVSWWQAKNPVCKREEMPILTGSRRGSVAFHSIPSVVSWFQKQSHSVQMCTAPVGEPCDISRVCQDSPEAMDLPISDHKAPMIFDSWDTTTQDADADTQFAGFSKAGSGEGTREGDEEECTDALEAPGAETDEGAGSAKQQGGEVDWEDMETISEMTREEETGVVTVKVLSDEEGEEGIAAWDEDPKIAMLMQQISLLEAKNLSLEESNATLAREKMGIESAEMSLQSKIKTLSKALEVTRLPTCQDCILPLSPTDASAGIILMKSISLRHA
jgi:hypothetical protein